MCSFSFHLCSQCQINFHDRHHDNNDTDNNWWEEGKGRRWNDMRKGRNLTSIQNYNFSTITCSFLAISIIVFISMAFFQMNIRTRNSCRQEIAAIRIIWRVMLKWLNQNFPFLFKKNVFSLFHSFPHRFSFIHHDECNLLFHLPSRLSVFFRCECWYKIEDKVRP